MADFGKLPVVIMFLRGMIYLDRRDEKIKNHLSSYCFGEIRKLTDFAYQQNYNLHFKKVFAESFLWCITLVVEENKLFTYACTHTQIQL